MLAIVVVILALIVLAGAVLSKLSVMALVFAMSGKFKDDDPDAIRRSYTAFVMLATCMFVPNFLTFIQSVWRSCYRSKRNDPSPSMASTCFIFIQCVAEVGGSVLFMLSVGPRVQPALLLLFMCSMFLAPAITRLWAARKLCCGRKAEESEHEPLLGGIQHPPAPLPKPSEAFSVLLATITQAGAIGYVPYFVATTDASLESALLFALSLLLLSICWLPGLQRLMVRPSSAAAQCTSRVKTGIIASIFRMGLLVAAVFIVVTFDPRLETKHLSPAFRDIASSDLLTPFLVHLIVSFVGYHSARLACIMSVQTAAFAIPLTLATPVSFVLAVLFPTQLPYGFALPSFPTEHLIGIVVVGALVWLSQVTCLWEGPGTDRRLLGPLYCPCGVEQKASSACLGRNVIHSAWLQQRTVRTVHVVEPIGPRRKHRDAACGVC